MRPPPASPAAPPARALDDTEDGTPDGTPGGTSDGTRDGGGEGSAERARGRARDDGPDRNRMRRWLIGAVLFLAAVVVPLLRQRGIPAWQSLFAEDGWVYLGDVERSGLSSVWQSYNGYLQLIPRILALPAPFIEITRVSEYFAVVSTAFSALVAWLAYRCTKGWVASVPMRLLVALMVVLAAPIGREVTGALANTIWPAFAVLPWAIVALNEGRRDVVFRAAFVFLAAASTALALVFVPLAIGFALWRRTRASFVVAGFYLAGVVAQGWSITHSHFVNLPAVNSVKSLVEIFSVRVVGGFVIGDGPLPWLWAHLGVLTGVLATVVLVVALAVSFFRAQRRNAGLALAFLVMAGLTFVVPVWLRGTSLLELTDPLTEPASRYVFAPVLLILSAFTLLLDSPDPSRNRKVAQVGRVILIAQTLLVIILSFSLDGGRGEGPAWVDGVAQARQLCASPGGGDGGREVDVIINPRTWHVTLTCDRLTR